MEWYYSNNGQQAGPVSLDHLAELFRNGTVKPSDLVWNETMTEWTPIGKVDAFAVPAPELPAAAPPAPVDSPPIRPKSGCSRSLKRQQRRADPIRHQRCRDRLRGQS